MATNSFSADPPMSAPRPGEIGVAAQWLGPSQPADTIGADVIDALCRLSHRAVPTHILGRGSPVDFIDPSIIGLALQLGGAFKAGHAMTAVMLNTHNRFVDRGLKKELPSRTLQLQLILSTEPTRSHPSLTIVDLVACLPTVREALSSFDHYLLDLYGVSKFGSQVMALDLNPEHLAGGRLRRLRSDAEEAVSSREHVELPVRPIRP